MPYDALTMHAVIAEIRDRAEGGRVDRALLLGRRVVGLEVFAKGRRFSLVFDLAPEASRVFLTNDRPRLERLLRLRLSARVDRGIPRDLELIAEVMGRRANLVLVDEDGSIMDAL